MGKVGGRAPVDCNKSAVPVAPLREGNKNHVESFRGRGSGGEVIVGVADRENSGEFEGASRKGGRAQQPGDMEACRQAG